MRISTLEEYGIRCALQLAREYGQGPVAASQIAKLERISTEYVGKIMFLLRKSGLVQAERGTQGGFFLTREPHAVNLKELVDALSSSPSATATATVDQHFCNQFSGTETECVHQREGECAIRPVWSVLMGYFDDVLSKLTLGDLLQKEKAMHVQVHEYASGKARRVLQTFTEESP